MGNLCCVDDSGGKAVGLLSSDEVSMGEELKTRTEGLVVEQTGAPPEKTTPSAIAISDEELAKQMQGTWKRDKALIATVQGDSVQWVAELSRPSSKWKCVGQGKIEVSIKNADGDEKQTAEFKTDGAKPTLRWSDGGAWVREDVSLAEQLQGRWKREGDDAIAAIVQDGNIVWAPYFNVTSAWKVNSPTKVEISMAQENGEVETHTANYKPDAIAPSLVWDDGEVWIKAQISLIDQIQGSWKRAGILIGNFKGEKFDWVAELQCPASPVKSLSARKLQIQLNDEKHTAELQADLVVLTLIWSDGEVWIKE